LTDRNRLLSYFRDEWLPPLEGRRYLAQREGVRVESLRKKGLHLVFEEGSGSKITAETVEALKIIKREARRSKVEFKWFVFAYGQEFDGPTYLKARK